ncbi:hypothetical protein FSP39_014086 [Pinctada imbricata]|uniref:Uncharacterized protein n=1 Tax=Pinctada imbricata TaxID=66713 RepID=A0AA89BUT8_PINIB|nr:hypothetical protein FSP39_014086 [Pinctada imbricata]
MVHRSANRRLMIGALIVLFLAVIAAIAGVVIFLASKEDTPRSTPRQFSPVFDIQFSINKTWNPNYGDPNSADFQQLSTRIRNELDSIFRAAMNNAGEQYNYTEIISFSNGSIVTKCTTYWKRNSHTQKTKDSITITPIDDVLIYQTLLDGSQTAENDPVTFPLLSNIKDGSITVVEVDTDKTPTTTSTTTTLQGINIPDHNVMIKYTLDQNQGIYFSDFMNISVRFNTLYNQGFLFWINDEATSDYVSMDINDFGRVRFTAKARYERVEVNSANVGHSYTDGKEHTVRMWRTGSDANELHLQVDNDQEALLSMTQPSILSNDPILTKPKFMYLGKNETTQNGFKGCISHIEIDGVNPLVEIYRVPRPSFIDVTPNNTILRNDVCGYDDITVDVSDSVCQNESLLVQFALPCLATNLGSVLAAQNQTMFCSVLENIADCIVDRIYLATSVQCTDDDKYDAVRKFESQLNIVFATYGITYQIQPCKYFIKIKNAKGNQHTLTDREEGIVPVTPDFQISLDKKGGDLQQH